MVTTARSQPHGSGVREPGREQGRLHTASAVGGGGRGARELCDAVRDAKAAASGDGSVVERDVGDHTGRREVPFGVDEYLTREVLV